MQGTAVGLPLICNKNKNKKRIETDLKISRQTNKKGTIRYTNNNTKNEISGIIITISHAIPIPFPDYYNVTMKKDIPVSCITKDIYG